MPFCCFPSSRVAPEIPTQSEDTRATIRELSEELQSEKRKYMRVFLENEHNKTTVTQLTTQDDSKQATISALQTELQHKRETEAWLRQRLDATEGSHKATKQELERALRHIRDTEAKIAAFTEPLRRINMAMINGAMQATGDSPRSELDSDIVSEDDTLSEFSEPR